MARPCKKRTVKKHAQRRLTERTGNVYSQCTLDRFVKDIQQGRAEFIDRQSNRITRWFVELDGQRIALVYDKMRKQIVTVLTEDMIKDDA